MSIQDNKKPLVSDEKIIELALDNYCYWEYDDGSIHECYEFSKEELIKFAKEIIK